MKRTSQKRRFDMALLKFIEAYVDLNGSINTTALCEQFGMHRTRASKVLTMYREHPKGKPSNLKFNTSTKMYDKGVLFEKVFLKESSWGYMQSVYMLFGEGDEQVTI